MISLKQFLIERTVISYRELDKVHKVAALIQAAIINKIRSIASEHLSEAPDFIRLYKSDLPAAIWKYFPIQFKAFDILLFHNRNISGSLETLGFDTIIVTLRGCLAPKVSFDAPNAVHGWISATERSIHSATSAITHEVTHLFQFLKDQSGYVDLPRISAAKDPIGYLNTPHEVEAAVSGFMAAFDRLTRRKPTLLAGVHTVDEMIRTIETFGSDYHVGQYYGKLTPANQRRFRVKFLQFLRDRRTQYSKFLDPIWFDDPDKKLFDDGI